MEFSVLDLWLQLEILNLHLSDLQIGGCFLVDYEHNISFAFLRDSVTPW